MKTVALILVLFLAVVFYLETCLRSSAPPPGGPVSSLPSQPFVPVFSTVAVSPAVKPFAGAAIDMPSARLTEQELEDGWTEIRQGIFDGEFERLVEVLRLKLDDEFILAVEKDPLMVSYQHGQLGSLLIHACSLGRLKSAQYLIDHGADSNVATRGGETPLSACIFSTGNSKFPVDHVNLIDLILKSGADATTVGTRKGKWSTSHDMMIASDTYLEYGIKLQRSKPYHFIPRNAVLARLRDHLDLPCDAMLPINANSLYLIDGE